MSEREEVARCRSAGKESGVRLAGLVACVEKAANDLRAARHGDWDSCGAVIVDRTIAYCDGFVEGWREATP